MAVHILEGEGETFFAGETVTICYDVSRPMFVDLDLITPTGTIDLVTGPDDGSGDCLPGIIDESDPPGRWDVVLAGEGGAFDTTFFFVGSSTRTVTVEITYLQSSAPGSSAGGDISLTTPGYSQLQAFSVVDIIEITFTDVPAGQYLLAIAFERFTFGDPISSHTCMVSGTLDEISVDLFECAGIQP